MVNNGEEPSPPETIDEKHLAIRGRRNKDFRNF